MPLNAPSSVEVEQIQFKIHDKFQIFQSSNILKNNINLLATSSTKGLVFVGNPYKGELIATQLKTLVEARDCDGKLYARTFQIPCNPNCIATSCDGFYLAVNYSLNNSAFLAVYSVPSFYTANIIQNFSIKISPEDNVKVIQLLWNPIISNTLALVLSDGSVGMYNLKDNTYEFYSLDKSHQVLCGCWSPKGKQIVFGFRNGNIIQFKPDLKPARTIECPPNVVEGSFKTIAIQWLSTYQFAVSYLQDGEDMTPNLFIVNAPKSGPPAYVNYYDICYSASGPRIPQVFFMHIQPWNILLVANSNSMEIGILGTSETGEAPNWTEYNLNDSCRLNLPMTKDKLETHPIGFCLETGSNHQLVIGETEIPVMPMIHVLSTRGQLIVFDFLNLYPSSPGICSPPVPMHDCSGLSNFKELLQESEEIIQTQMLSNEQITSESTSIMKTTNNTQSFGGFAPTTTQPSFFAQPQTTHQAGFSIGGPPQSLFGSNLPPNNSSSASLFGNNSLKFGSGNTLGSIQQQQPPSVTNPISDNQTKASIGFGNIKLSAAVSNTENNLVVLTTITDNPDKNKPLYTVPPIFTPPTTESFLENKSDLNKNAVTLTVNDKFNIKDPINYDYIQEMIQTEIQCFELELKELSYKSRDINISIGNMENIKNYTKKLDELQETINKEKNNDFETDIQILRHSVNECFTMIAEVRSKLEFFENPQLSKIVLMPSNDQAIRRQLARLNSMLTNNEAYLKIVKQQIDANWSDFQDIVQKNSSTKMHVPSLEGVYQTMTKQKNILAKERQKIAHLKSRLNFPGLQLKQITNKKTDVNADSLADSILSMSLSEQVYKEHSRLNNEKLQALRDALQERKIINITPQRPDRLQSEVILKSKIRTKKTEINKTKAEIAPISDSIQTNTGSKTEINNVANSNIWSRESDNPKVLQEEVSLLTSQPFSSKTQTNPAPISFSSSIGSTKPLGNNMSGVSFGNMGLNLSKTNVSQTDNKNSTSSSTLLFPKNQNPLIPINNSPAIVPTKPFGVSGIFNPSTSNAPILSFGNLSSTISPNLAFGNIANKASFTPVSSIQTFNNSTSGLTFNTKNPAITQITAKTQVPQVVPALSSVTSPKQALLFQTPIQSLGNTALDNSQSSTMPIFSSNVDSKSGLPSSPESQTEPEKSISTDSFLENLNICKPTAKSSSAAPNINIFGSGVFTLNSQIGNNLNVTLPEPKTNFLSTFSSTSKSPIFDSTSIGSNTATSSVPIPFVFAQTTTTPGTNTDSTNTKPLFNLMTTPASTANIDVTKPMFNVSKSSSVLSFGTTQVLENTETELQPVAKIEQQISTSLSPTSTDVTKTIESTQKTDSPTPVNLSFNTSTLSTSTASKTPVSLFGGFTIISSESDSESKIVSSPSVTSNTSTSATVALPLFSSNSATPASLSSSSSTSVTASTFSFAFPSLETLSTATTTASPSSSSISFGTPTSSVHSPFVTNTSASNPISGFDDSTTINTSNTLQPASTTTTAANTGNIFSGIPKPDQSVFGQTSSFGNIFAQTGSTPQFEQKSPPTTTVPSIFGGSGSFGGDQKSSAFGNSVPSTHLTSVFVSTTEQKTDSTQNIFGSPSSTATNSGSIFSRSPFSLNSNTGTEENSENIFGSQSGNLPYGSGSGGSIFGGGASNSNQPSSTSPFGGGSFSSGIAAGTTGFGGFGTNSVQNQPPAAFGQGGGPAPQASQASFVSPNTSLQKPTFGGPPTFGSPSAFGNSPTFGGVPTFGSGIKGFGSYTSPTSTGQTTNLFGSPTQKSEYFEALGSSNDSLSFGNLAQNANANSAKPNFVAGSSFSNWR